jgi:hypothetical protein
MQMHAGFAEREITPPVGTEMEGFNRPEPARGVHDPLKVRTLALQQGQREAAIVGLDLLFYERGAMDRLKGRIARQLGLFPRQVLVNFSHTHSGPRVSRWHYSGKPSQHYLLFVETQIVESLSSARKNLRPVRMEAAMGTSRLPLSRRRINEQGRAEWGPDPDAPVCRALPLCLFRDNTDHVVAYLFSVSCHPTINHAPTLSAEFPGVAVRRLNEYFRTGGGIFLAGAGGDAKPTNIARGQEWLADADFDDVEAAGRIVAEDVVSAVQDLKSVQPALHCGMEDVPFALEHAPSPEHLRRKCDDPNIPKHRRRWAKDMLEILRLRGTLPTHAELFVQGVLLAEHVRIVGVEAELGSELGRQIMRTCPEEIAFPLGYTNGSRINLPCDRQLPQGGYGVDTFWEYHWPARLAPGVDDTLERAVRGLCRPWSLE